MMTLPHSGNTESRRVSLCPGDTHSPGEGALQRKQAWSWALKAEQEFVGTSAVVKGSLGRLQREAWDSQHVRAPRLVQGVAHGTWQGHGRDMAGAW